MAEDSNGLDPVDVDIKWIGRNLGKVLVTLVNPIKLFNLSRDEKWAPHAHLAILIELVIIIGVVVIGIQAMM